jgi:hypothetical protein
MATDQRRTDPVLLALTRHLDLKPRSAVMRRHEAMLRELSFLGERENENLAFIRSRNWTEQRLSVLFSLNCIYQEVLGPLDASARTGQAGLGTEHPIVHGSLRFDSAHTARVRSAVEDFFTMVGELGFRRDWMTKNTCGDLVYYIARHERESNADGDQGGRV